MTERVMLLFERYLLAARVFSQRVLLSAQEKATSAAAADQDGWHDEAYQRAAYQVAMEGTKFIELKSKLNGSDFLGPDQVVPSEDAGLGAVVKLVWNGDPETETYLLTGDIVVPESGFITIHSPLGKALAGSSAGSLVDVRLPGGLVQIRILCVSFDLSAKLLAYLRDQWREAEKELKHLLTPSRLSLLSRHAKGSISDNERDYLVGISPIVAHTAMVEAVLFTVRAYDLSASLENDCEATIMDCQRAFADHDVPFLSLTETDLL